LPWPQGWIVSVLRPLPPMLRTTDKHPEPHLRLDDFVLFALSNDDIGFCTNMNAFSPLIVSICDMNAS
jgi:hypothetical protein